MEKVDMTTWGGTKVRNNLKPLWKEPVADDAEFGQYQQSVAKSIQNTNELIDLAKHLEAEQANFKGVLARRPF